MSKLPDPRHERVMIIDDNDLDNFISKRLIQSSRFANKVYEHTSARSALEFLQNLIKIGYDKKLLLPEVIFVDLKMPEIDGFQFLELYQKLDTQESQRSKLVILTSSVSEEDEYKAKKLVNGITYLRKPLTAKMLEEV